MLNLLPSPPSPDESDESEGSLGRGQRAECLSGMLSAERSDPCSLALMSIVPVCSIVGHMAAGVGRLRLKRVSSSMHQGQLPAPSCCATSNTSISCDPKRNLRGLRIESLFGKRLPQSAWLGHILGLQFRMQDDASPQAPELEVGHSAPCSKATLAASTGGSVALAYQCSAW